MCAPAQRRRYVSEQLGRIESLIFEVYTSRIRNDIFRFDPGFNPIHVLSELYGLIGSEEEYRNIREIICEDLNQAQYLSNDEYRLLINRISRAITVLESKIDE